MNFGDSIRTCLSKYATFQGRASRSEYWFFILFGVIALVVASIVDGILGTGLALYGLVALGLFLPQLAAGVRRLHDVNRSGWWMLIVLVPLLGPILLLIWTCSPGTAGDNDHGANPLGGGAGFAVQERG